LKNEFGSEASWSKIWIQNVEVYLAAPSRCGYWIASHFAKSLTILEVAGGSCRDSRYLATKGYNAVGSDFNQNIITYLTDRYPASSLKLLRENAFCFSFGNRSLDLTFANGFWIYFTENEQLYDLIREQVRISKKYVVSLVHNIENDKLVKSFQEKAKLNPLYDIRFFHRSELGKIIGEIGIKYKSVTIKKFGGPIDILFSRKILGVFNPIYMLAKYIVPFLYKYQPWSRVERIVLIIELE
jgi:hypothetical protein